MTKATILAHLDDVGVSYGSLLAWKALRQQGVVRTASAMVPCPWYPMIIEDYKTAPEQDLGIHITLTSEWKNYRIRPIIGKVRSLCDDDGYFHCRTDPLVEHADPIAVKEEVEAQIVQMLENGITPTHMDAHMGCIYLDPFIESVLELSKRYNIPIFYCKTWSGLFSSMKARHMPSRGKQKEIMQELKAMNNPIFDDFLITFAQEPVKSEEWYKRYLKSVAQGVHWLALHANAPGDLHSFAPHHAWPREQDYAFFSSEEARLFFQKQAFQLTDFRSVLKNIS